ncbi:sulfatase [Neolewinella agarilytica]|uniref:sulfatase n=1 Tax=Neolewinella agarilytica TaxID=478744 RepID=UPI002356A3DE|nr:sulfatase [Neolewinella agarilytica]
MQHSPIIRSITALALLTFFCTCGPAPNEEKMAQADRQPNVLFIAVDDLRPELASFGRHVVHSPNADRLAAMGSAFTNAYCNVPVCGASRASIMTGLRPLRDRFWDFRASINQDAPDAISLHGHFKANGYYAAAVGKVLHHASDRAEDYSEANWKPGVGNGAGRDYQMPDNMAVVKAKNQDGLGPAFERGQVADTAYWDGKIASEAIRKIEELAPKDQPFFLAVGFMKPHLPFNAPEKYWALYDEADISLPATYYRAEGTPDAIHHNFGELRTYTGVPKDRILPEAYARNLIQGYYASVSFMDAQLGRVLDALEASGEADNTIIVFWGDHGWNLGDHAMWCKHTTFNTSLRVPLIFSAPGFRPGRPAAMVEYVDIFPTLCDLAGLEKPEQLQGKSLLPLMEEPERDWTDHVLTRWKEADNITTSRYSYTEWYDDEGNRYARTLFDHQTDSLEINNLAEKEAYLPLVEELAARLPIGAKQ